MSQDSPRLRRMLLTVQGLHEWLNIPKSTLYAWVAQGRIPCLKIHGLVRFDREAIAEWLKTFAPAPATRPPSFIRHDTCDIDQLIEAAKRKVYTPRHGETITPSPREKEEQHGAR